MWLSCDLSSLTLHIWASAINTFPAVQYSINIIFWLMYEPLLFVARGTGLAPDHQTENIKLIFHSAPPLVRQIYVDILSINGWKIDGIWCPWVEHEAAGGIVDTSAIFGRSPVLSSNLVGQPTDALLHALVWCLGKGTAGGACHRNVPSLSQCV